MKKLIICALCAIFGWTAASAQKFALVDMEYILKNIPAYERANEQLNQVSKQWQAEVDAIYNAVKDIAETRGYQLILDRASDTGIIFGSPKIDISTEVLRKLGY